MLVVLVCRYQSLTLTHVPKYSSCIYEFRWLVLSRRITAAQSDGRCAHSQRCRLVLPTQAGDCRRSIMTLIHDRELMQQTCTRAKSQFLVAYKNALAQFCIIALFAIAYRLQDSCSREAAWIWCEQTWLNAMRLLVCVWNRYSSSRCWYVHGTL